MHNLFLETLLIILSFFSYFILIMINKNFYNKNNNQIQDIHTGEISRFGGLVIFIFFIIYSFINLNYQILNVIFFGLICLLPALLEDIRLIVKPLTRLILIFISTFLIILLINDLPRFNISFINFILNNYIFQIMFFSIAMVVVINGQNIIDGANGLSAFTSISSFLCILYIGIINDDNFIIENCIFIILLITVFLIFNYPLGKIFLGDFGSYFLGLIIGYFVIYCYGKYPELPTFSAAIIVIYQAYEVIFSYIRKFLNGKSPLQADNNHTHSNVFKYIKINLSSKFSNSIVALILSVLWLTPYLLFYATINFKVNSIYLLVIFITIYMLVHYFFYFKTRNIFIK